MKLLINLCAHDGIVSHYAGVGTIVKRYIEVFDIILKEKSIDYEFNLFTPEYNHDSFGYSEYTKLKHSKMKKVKIFQVSNGTNGTLGYGTPVNWKTLSKNVSKIINKVDFNLYDIVLTVANDTPYGGMLEMLNESDNHIKVWIPHSTGKIHLVDSSIENSDLVLQDRLKWEKSTIDFINNNNNSYLGSTGKYIEKHLIEEYGLNKDKSVLIINGEVLSKPTIYEETEEMKDLFNQIKDYDNIILSFGRAEPYKNLDATMYLGEKLKIKPVVIAQGYFEGQPLIKELKKKANETNSKIFVDVPFYLAQYIVNHFNNNMVLLIPSKKEIVGLIINEIRKMNKENVLIVANDIGGMHEQINDGVDGVLVDLTNIEESAIKIKKYFNDYDIKRINKNAQKRLNLQYDFEKICNKFLTDVLGDKYE